MTRCIIFLMLASFLSSAFAAQSASFAKQTISADRPGILYGTSIVPIGHLQLEAGLPQYQHSSFQGGYSTSISTPTFLRFGLTNSFELQLGDSFYNHMRTTINGRNTIQSGAGDLQLGAKYALPVSGGPHVPALTLAGFVTVPTGDNPFSAQRPSYNLNAIASWTLRDNTGFGTMLSYSHTPTGGGRYADTGTIAASLGHSFTARLGGYVELGYFPGFNNASGTGLTGGGLTYLVTNHIQVDGFFDRGLNNDSPDWLLGVGLSVLF